MFYFTFWCYLLVLVFSAVHCARSYALTGYSVVRCALRVPPRPLSLRELANERHPQNLLVPPCGVTCPQAQSTGSHGWACYPRGSAHVSSRFTWTELPVPTLAHPPARPARARWEIRPRRRVSLSLVHCHCRVLCRGADGPPRVRAFLPGKLTRLSPHPQQSRMHVLLNKNVLKRDKTLVTPNAEPQSKGLSENPCFKSRVPVA